jgi:hypothetical protein
VENRLERICTSLSLSLSLFLMPPKSKSLSNCRRRLDVKGPRKRLPPWENIGECGKTWINLTSSTFAESLAFGASKHCSVMSWRANALHQYTAQFLPAVQGHSCLSHNKSSPIIHFAQSEIESAPAMIVSAAGAK